MLSRSSGVLMPVSALFGDYSIGSFGESCRVFIDFLADCGFSYWQVLPFCMVDECNSPYKSYSAFGGNPYFIDLAVLREKGLLTDDELREARQETPYSCEYVRLYHTRCELLMRASRRVKDRAEIERFIESDRYLADFCRFMALKNANAEKPWIEWTVDTPDDDVLFLWKFIQYEFFTEWAAVRAYAAEKHVKLIGDIPIYVSFDSSDVWANRSLFQLDRDGHPSCVAGVPPDYFSADGQLWGNPLYDWDIMKKDGYAWWCDRLRHNFSLFDCVRIDHFRALESYWSIPASAESAKEGHWEKGPGKDFIDVIKSIGGDGGIIAEDLGDITKEVADLVAYSGFPGMRVLQFGFLSDDDSIHKPHNYPGNCVAYTGTHDNNTLLGYVWELDDNTRRKMLAYCGYTDPAWDRGYASIIRTLFASHASLVILPIQDILGFGSDTRFNIPGKPDGNWRFRITREQLFSVDRAYYRRLNDLYKRI